jgi:hypothetical protein
MAEDPWAAFPVVDQPPQTTTNVADPWAAFPVVSDQQTAPTAPRPPSVVRAEYDQLPWYQKAGQAADDIVRSVANGATFGFADKLAGYLNGTGTDAERAKSQEALDRAGGAGTVAELTGAVATPIGLARNGVALAGRFGTDAMQGLPGLAARTGLMATEGAGYGAVGAAGHDQNVKNGALLGAIMGGGANVVGEGLAVGANKVAGAFNKQPVIPTADQLRQRAQAAYQAADAADVVFTPQAVTSLRNRVFNDLVGMGYDPALQPGAAAIVRRLDDLHGNNVSLTGLDSLRKVAGNGYVAGNNSNNRAVAQIIAAIDDAVANPTTGDVLFGNAAAGSNALTEARALWSQLAKANTISEARDSAALRAASTGAGGNIDNATRQNMRRVYENGRGFTPDENDALLTAIRGTPGQNALRLVGRLAPTGVVSGGIGASIGAGAGSALGGPAGAAVGSFAVPAVGQVAKMTADRVTGNNVQNLLDIIMAGGSRAATQARPNAAQRFITANDGALVRAIMGGGLDRASGGR